MLNKPFLDLKMETVHPTLSHACCSADADDKLNFVILVNDHCCVFSTIMYISLITALDSEIFLQITSESIILNLHFKDQCVGFSGI